MNRMAVIAIAAALIAAGCDDPQPVDPYGQVNMALTNSLGDEAITNAVIRQHTLYPYHFVPNGAVLNELGQRDLDVLIDHYRTYPGELNIRRGDESERLYAQRTEGVLAAMVKAEIDAAKVKISDGTPGGAGMTSEEVIEISKPKSTAAPQSAPPLILQRGAQ